eukprot:6457544-Amphidinium_carterae.2
MFLLYVHDDAGGQLVLDQAVEYLQSALRVMTQEMEPASLVDLLGVQSHVEPQVPCALLRTMLPNCDRFSFTHEGVGGRGGRQEIALSLDSELETEDVPPPQGLKKHFQ